MSRLPAVVAPIKDDAFISGVIVIVTQLADFVIAHLDVCWSLSGILSYGGQDYGVKGVVGGIIRDAGVHVVEVGFWLLELLSS